MKLNDFRFQKQLLLLTTSLVLTVLSFANSLPVNEEPNFPPWEPYSTLLPWSIHTQCNGINVFGNAYTLFSDDGIFDKPFIFVEGIDFGQPGLNVLENGSFGWDDFWGLDLEQYPIMEKMPLFLNEIRSQEYDIILLDFADGAADLTKNAALLEHLLNLVNAHKIGNEPNVVAGASMGGVIARIALKNIEIDPLNDHCTRLYISLDAPHKGAHIPSSVQYAVEFFSQDYEQAQSLKEGVFLRKATRQLLIDQLIPFGSLYDDFQTYLDELGYPEQCRNVAVSNGSVAGIHQSLNDNEAILDYTCYNVFNDPVFKLELYTDHGNPNETDVNGNHVIAHIINSSTNLCDDSPCDQLWCTDETKLLTATPQQFPSRSILPGGTRTTMIQFAEQVNEAFSEACSFPSSCGYINANDYIDAHAFLPTYSAFDLPENFASVHLFNEIETNEDLELHFDRYFGPYSENEAHSSVSDNNLPLMLDEVFLGENQLPMVLNAQAPNNGIYNYGSSINSFLYDVTIENGGEVHINDNLPLDFGNGEFPVIGSHYVVNTAPCAESIVIGSQGKLIIGNSSSGNTADLIIGKHTLLEIQEGGELIISTGSRLILSSAQLHTLSGSSILIENGGEIIVDDYSSWVFSGGEINFNGIENEIILDGVLNLQDAEMNIGNGNASIGKIIVRKSGTHIIGYGELNLKGNGLSNEVLKISSDVTLLLDENLEGINISQAKVMIEDDARIVAPCKFYAKETRFESNGTNSNGLVLMKENLFRSCEFLHVPINAELYYYNRQPLRIEYSFFAGYNSSIRVEGMGYRIKHSHFLNSALIYSENLTMPSLLYDVQIDGQYDQSDTYYGTSSGVFDDSNVDLQVKECHFKDCGKYAIKKRRGKLTLKCSTLENNTSGIVGSDYAILNLSTNEYGGYNIIKNNITNIELSGASDLRLQRGFNQLSGFYSMNIEGSLAGDCSSNCQSNYEILADRNRWVDEGPDGGPNPNFNNVYRFTNCDLEPEIESCNIPIIANQIAVQITCNDDITVKPLRKNNIEMTIGKSISKAQNNLQNQCTAAAQNLTFYNDSGNDFEAIDDLYIILMNEWELPNIKGNYWYLLSLEFFKTAIETLLAENTDEQIENYLLKYVDVLNHNTLTELDEWNHYVQFNNEMKKAQLILTCGNRELSSEIMNKVDDCGLREIEQNLSLKHQSRLNYEMAFLSSTLNDLFLSEWMVEQDEISIPASEEVIVPIFGSHIDNLFSVSFMICSEWEENMTEELNEISVVPNPFHQSFRLTGLTNPDLLTIVDIQGQSIPFEILGVTENSIELLIDAPVGIYLCRVVNKGSQRTIKIIHH